MCTKVVIKTNQSENVKQSKMKENKPPRKKKVQISLDDFSDSGDAGTITLMDAVLEDMLPTCYTNPIRFDVYFSRSYFRH